MSNLSPSSRTRLKVALAGQQNAGKSTLFNALTGARQHIANYPGVTVEKKSGIYVDDGLKVEVVDLPGTYSLTSFSLEERVARDFLLREKPDVIVNVVDASTLERGLPLTFQLIEMGVPVVVALNMMDVAKRLGLLVDPAALAERLGVPIELFYSNVAKYGNTSAASIPLALSEAAADGRFASRPDRAARAIGGGLTWGAGVIRW
ncbi:MAG: GTP-binding protein [Bacteroidales bacterium]|nr:GTP-binding protein [Bacteroidales bacterium]